VGLVAAAAFAVGDWVAKARDDATLEYACKPLTMVALVVAALALEPVDDATRAWFVAALVLSLAGDVFLMLPERELGPADTFTFGLGSFLSATSPTSPASWHAASTARSSSSRSWARWSSRRASRRRSCAARTATIPRSAPRSPSTSR
jgi:uncharacterized membrane protein YhhN